jgi:hypothetical protein
MVKTFNAFWDFMTAVERSLPLTPESAEKLLGTNLEEHGSSSAFAFYVGGPLQLNDGTVIGVDLRMPREDPTRPAFLSFSIGGRCVERAQIGEAYGPSRLTGVPTGRSENEETAYSVKRTWGQITFGYSEKRPDCLSSVTFDPAGR